MKRLNIFLMLVFMACSCWINSVFAQGNVVTFPDDKLAAAVRSALGIEATDSILEGALQGLTDLSASGKEISDLTELGRATGLMTLELADNNIQVVSPLRDLTALTTLDLGQNEIVDLQPLGFLDNLETLDLADNRIETFAALSILPVLETLDLKNNSLGNLNYLLLEDLPELQTLYLEGNAGLIDDLTDFHQLDNARRLVKLKTVRGITIDLTLPSPVTFPDENLAAALRPPLRLVVDDPIFPQDMAGLTRLTVDSSVTGKIADLTGLETAVDLTVLTLNDNEITNLTPLANLTSLTDLNLADNTIPSLTALSGLINLTYLFLANNQITDVSPLRDLTGLREVDLRGNTNLTNLEALYKLKQGGTYFSLPDGFTIPDSVTFDNDALEAAVKSELGIGPDAPILETDLAENLTRLIATGKEIDDLTGLEGATALTTLDLGQNAITSIDPLGFLDNLETLDLADNRIQQIRAITNLPVLETLDLKNNSLISLDYLEDLPALQTLSLEGNAGLIDDLTDPDQLDNARRLVKLKTVRGITIDLTLPSPVTFPDENLAAALRAANELGFLVDDDPIFPEDMELLTDFNASNRTLGKEIVNLTGLEMAINVTILTLNGNEIASLTPLANLTSLTELNLADNTISSLTDLSGLINLRILGLSNNQITDVSPLRDLTGLVHLDLSGNTNLTNLGALYKLKQGGTTTIILPEGVEIPVSVIFENEALEAAVKSELGIGPDASILETDLAENLTRLIATGKEIDDLTGLEGATALTTLDLGQNAIADFGPLSNLTNLETLDLADNAIVNLPPNLSGLTRLVTLNLADNQIQDVSVGLPTVSSTLETLDLRNNVVGDVTPLSTMTSLKRLYLRGNANLQNVKLLVKLKEAGTTIDIPLPKPVTFRDDNLVTALEHQLGFRPGDPIFPEDMKGLLTLTASSGSIVNLTGLETATGLTSLTLNGNEIASLTPLARLEALETLNLADNENISSISSLARLTALTDLNLSNNKISSVSSLAKLTSLTNLNLASNTISSLTVLAGLTNLTDLNLSNNRITDVLPLQGLSTLQTLNLSGNENLTMEKASVLYTLLQGSPPTNITLPAGITLPALANIVRFEDLNLAAAVRTALRITKGYPILTTGEKGLDTLERLTATRKQIDNLTGLEDATALTTLDLGQNAIVSLTPLQNLRALTTLDLADNQITDFSPLSGLESLTTLDLGQNAIENLPTSLNLTTLVTLDLADNNIKGVSSLSGLSALKTLDLRDNSRSDDRDNDVTDVTPLSGLTLKTLYLRGNDNLISDLTQSEQLANARALVKLKFGDTRTTIDITLPRAVTFRDDTLETALRTAAPLNLEDDDPIFPADMARLTRLTVVGTQTSKVANLTGLETAVNLTSLTLNGNEIASLTPLARLEALETLNLADNENISSLSALARLTALTDLDLSNNKISSVSSLSRLTSLTDLNLSDNRITSVSSLSDLTSLTTLNLSNNSIRDVLPLAVLSSLRILNLDGNTGITNAVVLYRLRPQTTITGVTVPEPGHAVTFPNAALEAAVRTALRIPRGHPILPTGVNGLDTLTRLTATRKGINNLTGLAGAAALTTLDLGDNLIVDLQPLQGLMNLTTLDLADNQIADFGPLAGLSNLKSLDLDGNLIMNLPSDLTGLSSIEMLDLRDNDVRDVTPLSRLTTLKNLYVRGNDNLENIKRLANLGTTRVDIPLPDAVYIPDTNLAAALRTQLNLGADDPILPEDMERLTELTALSRDISDLTGMETATGLTDLTLFNNAIVDLEPLEDLTSLTTLNLSNNQIVDVSSLEELTNLTTLDLRDNQIIDVAPLAELTNLTSLLLRGNDSITNLGALYHLDQGGTTNIDVTVPDAVTITDDALAAAVRRALRIADTAPILPDAMARLTRLTASRRGITSLSGLEQAGLLETLDVGQNNEISDLTPLSGLTHLKVLDLADNNITAISALTGLTNLQTLDLRNNDVTDTTRLSEMTHLKNLYVRGNANLESLKQLVKLTEAGTRVDIPLPRPVTFRDENLAAALQTTLDALPDLALQPGDPIFPEDMAMLTDFDASNPTLGKEIVNLTGLETATKLTSLTLNGNEIASLTPLARLEALETLNLADNENISSISSLARLTALTDLNLSNNKISSVSSLSRLEALQMLNLADNSISSLTVLSGLSNLTDLNLSNNRITDVLPLQGLSTLRTLNLSGNENLTMEKASVLYTLQQANPSIVITLPDGIDLLNPADIVTFNNPDLAAAVRSALRITKGYPILEGPIADKKDITDLTRLTATRKNIDDLTGLEGATALTTLDLGQNNEISDISPLRNLTSLTTLDLADNKIENFSPLSGLTTLTTLDLGQNAIENVASLPRLTSLVTLDLADNQIQDVFNLSNLSGLETLDLRNNVVGDVTRLSMMTSLKRLYLRGNANLTNVKLLVKLKETSRTSIDITLPRPVTFRDANLLAEVLKALNNNPLNLNLQEGDPIFPEDMEMLTTFTASGQDVVNLTGLETATKLTGLTLNGNEIASLTPLARLEVLETLDLADNVNISSISSLARLTALTDLNLSNNKVSSVSSLSRLEALQTLNLADNSISSLTVLSGLINLTDLNLSNNRITDVLPLQGLSALRTLNLSGNVNLTMEKASVLYTLQQANPSIVITLPDGIDLLNPADIVTFNNPDLAAAVRIALRITKGYPILKGPIADKKDITDLTRLTATRKGIVDLTGLGGATNLTTLDLGDNLIVDLQPLRGLTSLTTLDLADNQIADFGPLAGLSNLKSLDLDGNQITTLPTVLTGLSSIEMLDLRDNDVRDVTPLARLTTLKNLYVRGNENLENIKRLANLGTTRVDIPLPDAVAIPDTNLAAALRTQLGLEADDPISPEDMNRLTELRALSGDISELTGMETATAVTSLTLSNNKIVDLEPLEDLTSLTTLILSNNQIVDVSPLEALTSLTFLNLENNQIIDVAPLAELTNLIMLLLRGNDNIINLGALYHLVIAHGGTTTIDVTVPGAVMISDDALAAVVRVALRIAPGDPILPDAMARLTRLTASRKGITSLSGLDQAGLLEILDVGQNNEISDLTPLSGLTNLKVLDLADNNITAISALSGLTTLQTLDLRNNDVTNTARLSTMTHLKNLYVRGNANLESPKQLVKLTEAGTRVDITLPRPVTFRDEYLAAQLREALNSLPDLNLQNDDLIFPEDMEMLTTFTASGQDIVNLTGLETATKLTGLTLNGNEIASLTPLARLEALETLDLADNENISSISALARLTALTNLNLSNNKISSVSSLSRLEALETLNLADNSISSLTVLSGLINLTALNLSNNRITDVLPLQGLSSLRTLNLDGNTGITNAVVLYRLRPQTTITGVTVPHPSTVVAFTNAALEAAVRTALRIPRGHPILPTGVNGLDTLPRLTATRKNIDDLTGLEGATALTYLDLGDNAIVNLSPIADLSSLTHLDVAGNEIATLGSPRFLTNLVNLDLGQNAIVTFPTLSDTDLPKLVTLDLADNKIADVSELSNLSVLETLDLRNNVVEDVTPLSTMESLKRLYLRGNMNLTNVKLLVKLKETSRTSIDITLPRPVTFRDEYLAARLREALNSLPDLNLQDDDLIFPEDMEMLTTFTASGAEIVNLTGLETATGLTTLNLSDNQIVSLSPLARLTELTELNLSSNSISSLSSLSRLTGLTTLNLNMNRISSVSSLSKLEALETLNLADNSISSLTALVGLSSLTDLDLSNNRITDVLPLQGLSALRTLNLSGNENLTMEKASVLYTLLQGSPPTRITLPGIDLPDLANIVRFEDLNLAAAVRTALRITKGYPILLTGEKGIDKLTRLTITHRRIASLTGLEEAKTLANLDVGNNQIPDLTPLESLTSLRWLDLADNLITDVQKLSGLTSLERLDLRNNQITDVTPLTGLTSLTRLYLRGNANLTNVKLLVKLENTLVDIPLPDPVEIPDTNLAAALRAVLPSVSNGDPIFPGDMEKLTRLTASGSTISDLTGLETATGLTDLTLSDNAIFDLEPLEDLTSLTDLNLSRNQIVDVSSLEALTSLQTLNLSNNQIEDVAPLAKLTNLTLLQLAGNSVTNPGALYHLNQQATTTITGITVPGEVTITDDALRAAVKRTLRIADADPILPDAMATLTRLTASRKEITSLEGLETAVLLERLDVGQNEEISVLTPLSGLTRLTHLDVADNKITNVSALSGLENLTTLDLRNNQITDVEPLKDLTSLRQIYIRGNEITNLAWLGALENLRSDVRLPSVVDIPDTNLDREVRAALTVTGTLPMAEELLESLETLTASGQSIKDLTGCEHMTSLTSLDLQDNQITDVTPLSKLSSLVTLRLARNTILDTSPLYQLTRRNLTDVDIPIYRYPSWDVNQDGRVDKVDLYLVTLIITGTQQDINGDGTFDDKDEMAADVNRDKRRDINDLRFVFDYLDRPVNLGAPLLNAETGLLEVSILEQMDADGLRVQLQILRMTDDGSLNHQQTVAFLQAILAAIQPKQTALLPNYPNPFNPETWIPYQLARDSHVRITIYDMQGAVIRRLELGYRVEGFYTSRDRAAHWDGRNAVGERVASGLYFYQLEAAGISLLRKMVILK